MVPPTSRSSPWRARPQVAGPQRGGHVEIAADRDLADSVAAAGRDVGSDHRVAGDREVGPERRAAIAIAPAGAVGIVGRRRRHRRIERGVALRDEVQRRRRFVPDRRRRARCPPCTLSWAGSAGPGRRVVPPASGARRPTRCPPSIPSDPRCRRWRCRRRHRPATPPDASAAPDARARPPPPRLHLRAPQSFRMSPPFVVVSHCPPPSTAVDRTLRRSGRHSCRRPRCRKSPPPPG